MALKTSTLLTPLILGASIVIAVLIYTNSRTPQSQDLPIDNSLNKAPECDFGHCPVYHSEYTDADDRPESVVWVPGAMNKGVGSIWIIDEGKVVFKSDTRPGISYDIPEDAIGINIGYITEYDEVEFKPKTVTNEEWRYKNGSYVLKNTVERE